LDRRGDEVTGVEKVQNKELRDLYTSKYNQNYQMEEDEVGEACGVNGGKRGTCIGYC
jgi:hypothetical protein